MPRVLTELREEVRGLLGNPTERDITTEQLKNALLRAVRVLSRKSPLVTFEEKTGDGTAFEWQLSTATYFRDFSNIMQVVCPFVVASQSPTLPLDPELDYRIYEKTAGAWYLILLSTKPATGEKVRITYTTRHSLTEVASTCSITSDVDEDRVVNFATAIGFRILAAKAAATGNPTISADSVAYQSRAGDYLRLAEKYEAASGLKPYIESELAGGMVMQDLDTADVGGEDWLTHPARHR